MSIRICRTNLKRKRIRIDRTEDEKELVVKDDQSNTEDFERLANMDSEMPENFDDFRTSANRTQEAQDRQHDLMANALERPESLNDYLMHQLAEMEIDDDHEQIAERIISTLDARNGGYFKSSLRDLLPVWTFARKITSEPKRHWSWCSRSSRLELRLAICASAC